MQGQTFIRPVPDIVEVLVKAAKYAGDKSLGNVLVTLEVRYLALHVKASHSERFTNGQAYKVYNREKQISWLELSEAVDGFVLLQQSIDQCVAEIYHERNNYLMARQQSL